MRRAFLGMLSAGTLACYSTSGVVPFDSRAESAFNVYAMRSNTLHDWIGGLGRQSGLPPGRGGAKTRGQRGGC